MIVNRQPRSRRAQRQAELESAWTVLHTPLGTPTMYGHAMQVIDQHLSGDSHAHWEQVYERRLAEIRRQ